MTQFVRRDMAGHWAECECPLRPDASSQHRQEGPVEGLSQRLLQDVEGILPQLFSCTRPVFNMNGSPPQVTAISSFIPPFAQEQINIHSGLTRTSSPSIQPVNTSGPTEETTLHSQPFVSCWTCGGRHINPGFFSPLWTRPV